MAAFVRMAKELIHCTGDHPTWHAGAFRLLLLNFAPWLGGAQSHQSAMVLCLWYWLHAVSQLTSAWLHTRTCRKVWSCRSLRRPAGFCAYLCVFTCHFSNLQACAEYLCAAGYCSPSSLTIQGGSNGGLLVAACANQRPDLYACVLGQVRVVVVVVGGGDTHESSEVVAAVCWGR